MIKAIGCFIFFVGILLYTNQRDMIVPGLIISLAIFYVIPFVLRKLRSSANEKQWQQEAERDRINRENNAEYEHQTNLRRERERLEMQAEVRVRELMATLEVQYHSDAQKMKQLTQMKTEFANRQQADMASLLGRLEAMKAG